MKTNVTNFTVLLSELLNTTPLYKEENPPLFHIKQLNGKPYLNIGPFWIKTNKGKYDIYIWDKIKGKLCYRTSYIISEDAKTVEQTYADSVNNIQKWWEL